MNELHHTKITNKETLKKQGCFVEIISSVLICNVVY